MIKSTFLNEEILIKQVDQKSVIFVTIDIFWIKGLSLNHMFVMLLSYIKWVKKI